ncbi:phosphatidylserine decarboxylase-domain-containing protein [Scheffersomyces xylosifermentans]|uniref:phosphatidylserine decarboxylase-domain-containing protein n=1 Tax=Scheffersomyces xylosifermentans TaxID=1304137 RepID=UPI00315D0C24
MRLPIKTRPKSNSVTSDASDRPLVNQEFQLFLKINATRAADLVSSSSVPSAYQSYSSRKSVNPVLVAVFNDVKKQTTRKLNTNQPSWDDQLVIPLKSNDYSQVLVLTVWDKHKRYKNYLGEVRLSIKDILYNGGTTFKGKTEPKWYKLYSNKEYHSYVNGSILLSFELTVKKRKLKRRERKRLNSKTEKGRSSEEDEKVPVEGQEMIVNPSSDLYNRAEDPHELHEEFVVSEVTETDKAIILNNWQKSLIDPEYELSTKPDEQGFYQDTNGTSNSIIDVSDIESIEPDSGINSNSNNGNISSASAARLPTLMKDSSSLQLPAKNKFLNVEDDVSSFSELSLASSDGEMITESDVPLSSFGEEIKTKRSKRSRLRKLRGKHLIGDDKFKLTNREVLGVIFIEIVSCSDLPPLKSFTRTSFDMDPFVVVTFGKKTFRTSWKRHTLNPIFNERVAFEILPHESTFNIQFSILDKDHFSFHDQVAEVSVPIKEITGVATALPMDVADCYESGMPKKSVSMMSLNMQDGFTTGDNDSPSQHSSIRIIDDNMIPSVRKKKFTNRQKVTHAVGDTSKFRSMNLAMKLDKQKYIGKYNPQLKIRVRFETYENLRRRFWTIVLEQYNLNEKENSYDYFELIALLDTLGCTNSDELVTGFYEKSNKSAWGGDLLTHAEIIQYLEDHVTSTKNEEENRLFELEKCPICTQKRLVKKDDIDIITHVAICASKDWSIVNKLLVSSYVTPQLATRKWFSKVLIKLTYGKYTLGGNSANILVQDRTTGIIMEEKMGVYVRLGIRLLYKGLDKAKTRRIRILLKKLSVKQGIKFDSPHSKGDIDSFIKFHKLDMSDCLEPDPSKYPTFNEFFYRKLKPGARPVESPESSKIVVSPADCRCAAFSDIDSATQLWIKGRNFTIAKLFNGNFNNYENSDLYKAEKCSIGIFRLAPQDYHRFHSPVDGTIQNIKHIDGEYYTVNPMAIRSELDVFGENVRAIIPIKTEHFGTVIMVAVGAMMVGSIVLTKGENDTVKRGDEIGYFKFGGSTILLLFEKRFFKFDSDIINNSKSCIETLIRVGQSIGHSPDTEEVKRSHIDFVKQSKNFKLNLIRVLTGGDLNDSKQLSNWESANIKITQEDLGDIVDNQGDEDKEEDDEFDEDDDSFDEEGSVNSDYD